MGYNFPDHIKGDTFDGVLFEVLENDLPVDLTGATINMDLRQTAASDTSLKRFSTTTNEIEITDPLLGKFQFKEQIVNVAAYSYYYDIEINYASGRTKTWIAGKWKIKQDVTHV
jgi:hypothetical protein